MSRGISQTDYGALRSGMSDASVASLLGRSLGWVERTRRQIEEQGAPSSASGPADTRAAVVPAVAPAVEAPCSAANSSAPTPRKVQSSTTRAPLPAARTARRPHRDAPARVERVASIKPRVVGWCRAYVAQGVGLDLLAELFNVDATDLRLAVQR